MKYTASTYSSGECEFEVVGAEGIVIDCDVNDFVKEMRFAEEVLGHPEPKPKRLWDDIE
jgi:hypothetical protein